MLSTFTTAQILNWGDRTYSKPAHDKLHDEQLTAVNLKDPSDPTARAEIAHKMRAILYRDSPYVILWHNTNLQAYRTEQWTGYGLVPPGGEGAPCFNLTRTTYQELGPIAASAAEDEGGSHTGLIVGIVIAVIVVAIVAVLLGRPKKAETE